MSVTTLTAQQELPAPEVKMNFEDKISELKQKIEEFSEQIYALEKAKELQDNAEINVQVSFDVKKFDVVGVGYRLEKEERYSGFIRIALSHIPHSLRETHITERGTASDVQRVCITGSDLRITAKKSILSILNYSDVTSSVENVSYDDICLISAFAPPKDSLSRKIDVLETETSYLPAEACTFEK